MTEREKIERLKQMLLRMCEAVECADCPLLGEECELAVYLTDERRRDARRTFLAAIMAKGEVAEMSATEELRRLLDERGIEWRDGAASCTTEWQDESGAEWSAMEWLPTLSVLVSGRTPIQAVEISLGRGKCKTVSMDCFGNPPFNMSGLNGNSTAVGCSECGAPWSTCGLFRGNALKHNFKACPICGREVEQ